VCHVPCVRQSHHKFLGSREFGNLIFLNILVILVYFFSLLSCILTNFFLNFSDRYITFEVYNSRFVTYHCVSVCTEHDCVWSHSTVFSYSNPTLIIEQLYHF